MSYLVTYSDVYKEVARNTGLDPTNSNHTDLSKKWTNAAYQEINNRKDWPWIMGRYAFRTTALEQTGTVTLTKDSRTVSGSGTSFAAAHVGQVFMSTTDIGDKYRINSVESATSLTLELPYIDASAAGAAFTIWTKYVVLASMAKQVLDPMWRRNDYPVEYKFKSDFKRSFPNPHLGTPDFWTQWGMDYKARSYSTGTVSGTTDASTLTGSSTAWLGNVQPGDKIAISTSIYHVKSVDSDTQITIVEKFTADVSAASYTISSEMAPTIILSGNPDPIEIVEYDFHKRTYPMLNDNEIPNLPQQFLDALVIGGMKYGFEHLGSDMRLEKSAQFEAEIKKASLTWDTSFKPDKFSFGAEAYARMP